MAGSFNFRSREGERGERPKALPYSMDSLRRGGKKRLRGSGPICPANIREGKEKVGGRMNSMVQKIAIERKRERRRQGTEVVLSYSLGRGRKKKPTRHPVLAIPGVL